MQRHEKLFHGTTVTAARLIASSGRFKVQKTWFVLGESKQSIAEMLARRAVEKAGKNNRPA